MKITRNLTSTENKAFWEDAITIAKEVRKWPGWKRAGINVSTVRVKEPKNKNRKTGE